MPVSNSNINRMYIFNFLLSMHFIGGVLIPFMTDWGGISFSQIMVLQSFFMISIFALEVPTGAVADYLGRKTSLILSAIVNAFAALVYSSQPNFYVFMVGEFLWAVGTALLSGADEALVYDSLLTDGRESESKRIFGRLESSALVALMVSAPIGSIIATTIGLRYTMMFLFIPCFLAAIVGLGLKEPKIVSERPEKKYFSTIKEGFKYFKGHSVLKLLAFDRIAIGNMVFMIIWVYQPLLSELMVPIFFFGFVHAAMTGVQILVLNSFSRMENILGSKRRYVLFSAVLPGVSFVLLALNRYIALAIVLILIISAFGLTRVILYQNYLNKYIDSHNRATVLSTISMISVLTRAVSYPLIGVLVEWSLRGSFLIMGGLTLIFALMSRVREEHLID